MFSELAKSLLPIMNITGMVASQNGTYSMIHYTASGHYGAKVAAYQYHQEMVWF
ncbi:MAG: hypothetical protein HC819_02795 [Cyclobacteriaceae bacterium]|nr:hypothetical protein [Cyclobacteriaceae bacterium]